MIIKKIPLKKIVSLLLVATLFFLKAPTNLFAIESPPRMQGTVITWQTKARAGTSNIRYRTIGWSIHAERIEDGNVTRSSIPHSVIEGVGVDSPVDSNGMITTTFTYSKQQIVTALENLEKLGGGSNWRTGGRVYLSAYTAVIQGTGSSERVLGKYKDLDKIKTAQSWSNPNVFNQYFNIPLTLDLAPENVTKQISVNGEFVESSIVTSSQPGTAHTVTFPLTYTTSSGEVATLERTWLEKNTRKGTKFFEIVRPNEPLATRNVTNSLGGINLHANYTLPLSLRIEHIDRGSGSVLNTETRNNIVPGSTVSASSGNYLPSQYLYSEVSFDKGSSWTYRSTLSTRTLNLGKSATLRFYYGAPDGIFANLILSASPSNIEKGKTETVTFTLNASGSTSKDKIVKYEWFFSGRSSDLDSSSIGTSTTSSKTVTQSGVSPKDRWYAKVIITDSNGRTSEETATITMGEIVPEVQARVRAEIGNVTLHNGTHGQIGNVHYDEQLLPYFDRMEPIKGSSTDIGGYNIYLKRDPAFIKQILEGYGRLFVDFKFDASPSWSTNGIDNYSWEFQRDFWPPDLQNQETSSSSSNAFQGMVIENDLYWMAISDAEPFTFKVKVTARDSVQTDKTATSETFYVHVRFNPPLPDPPGVKLTSNFTEYAYGETAQFAVDYTESASTYAIESKVWHILRKDGTSIERGRGDIPSEYPLFLEEGSYVARQFISWKDSDSIYHEDFSEVAFNISSIKDPSVSIDVELEKYLVPAPAKVFVNYFESVRFTHLIDERSWSLTHKDTGTVVASGSGTFPSPYALKLDLHPGMHIAEQTIFWYDRGVKKSFTATDEFKVISPIPAAKTDVFMKMNTSGTLKKIENGVFNGKQFREIVIDLSPSTDYNLVELENPLPLLYSDSRTQIKVVPLNSNGEPDYSKNNVIHTRLSGDKVVENQEVTIKGKRVISVRFDEPGIYKIKTRVTNATYTSAWSEKLIEIDRDLPPIPNISFQDVTTGNPISKYTTTRQSDLHVRFKVGVSASSQDDDVPNLQSGRLEIKYDYNANGNPLDDGTHSSMFITSSSSSLRPYITVANTNMTSFSIDMFETALKPILGPIRFEYSVGQTPTIPYFEGGNLPAIAYPRGTISHLPDRDKTVFVDNLAGVPTVHIGKEGIISVVIYAPAHTVTEVLKNSMSTIGLNLYDLVSFYRTTGKIYILDKNNKKQLIRFEDLN